MFFEYIKHENDDLGECYFSGIVCRYWGYIAKLYLQCQKHVSFEECYDCIINAIRYVLKKRVWENPDSSLYGDKAAPDKAVHIAFKRERAIMLAKLTSQKRCSNFNTLSIDGLHEEYADSADGMFVDSESESNDGVHMLISNYFNDDNYLEGMMLDTICYGNYQEYSTKTILRYLKEITPDYFNYYNSKYSCDKKKFTKTLKEVYNTSNRMLSIKLKSLLRTIQKEGIYCD